jgi:hypothetical protein
MKKWREASAKDEESFPRLLKRLQIWPVSYFPLQGNEEESETKLYLLASLNFKAC